MTQPSFAVRPRGQRHVKGKNTGPRPPLFRQAESKAMVTPLARGLAVLAAFGVNQGRSEKPERKAGAADRDGSPRAKRSNSHSYCEHLQHGKPPESADARGAVGVSDLPQIWVGNKQIALETGLPVSTVSRLLSSLVALGYVCYDKAQRKYRLTTATLALGYAAISDNALQRLAWNDMRTFAESTDTYVVLGVRDHLDVFVLDSHQGSQTMLALDMLPGARMNIAASIAGAALLAALPKEEQNYLFQFLERKGGCEWPEQRRRIAEKISQVQTLGFCTSPGEWVPDITSVSAPIDIPNHPPWVISCIGRTSRIPRMRLERELGPRLALLAQRLQEKFAATLALP